MSTSEDSATNGPDSVESGAAGPLAPADEAIAVQEVEQPQEALSPLTEVAHEAAADAQPQSMTAGQLLKAQRVAADVSLTLLAMQLKVSPKKLEAIENDEWSQLPDAVFVRALVSSVCRQIKADPRPVLALMPQPQPRSIIRDSQEMLGLNQNFKRKGGGQKLLQLLPSVRMMLAAGVLLLAALVLVLLPDAIRPQVEKTAEVLELGSAGIGASGEQKNLGTAQQPAPATPPATNAPLDRVESAAVATAVDKDIHSAASELSARGRGLESVVASAETPTAAPAISSAPGAAVSQSGNTPTLRVVAKGEVWIEVKDAKGALLARRTMASREELKVRGAPPLAVVIGRVNEIDTVEVRGKPLNLQQLSTDNVARFEVN